MRKPLLFVVAVIACVGPTDAHVYCSWCVMLLPVVFFVACTVLDDGHIGLNMLWLLNLKTFKTFKVKCLHIRL
jgi:hypothetical protein